MNIVEVPAAKGEDEPSHRYAISATEITRGQLKSLLPNETLADNLGDASDLPVAGITTFAALQFCKRLTAVQMQDDARHRLTQAVQTESSNSFRIDTHQNGIRLPTVDEWRIACEAGMNGDCFFGDLQFVDRYAWRTLDSVLQPVGTLLPNRFGLFDTYGNVREWAIGPAGNTGPGEQQDKEQEKEQGEQQDKEEGKQQVPIVLAPNSRGLHCWFGKKHSARACCNNGSKSKHPKSRSRIRRRFSNRTNPTQQERWTHAQECSW